MNATIIRDRFPKPANWTPDEKFKRGHHYAGSARCQHWNYNKGRQCLKLPVSGSTVCRSHGAGSPLKGRPGGRQLIHGRRSKRMPGRLMAAYEASLTDPEQLSLTNEIAVVDARLDELLGQLGDDSHPSWDDAGAALDKFLAVVAGGGSQAEHTLALDSLRSVVKKGGTEMDSWAGYREAVEQRRKLADTERKLRMDMQSTMDMQTLMATLGAVVSIIKEHVKDSETSNAIAEHIGRLVQRDGWGL